MQNAALAAAGLDDWRYQALPVPPERFEDTVRGLPGAGFRGANVTIPHKLAAFGLADSMTPAARAIGAANTLEFGGDGTISAANTDAPAVIATLPFSPAGRTALVLGAGGSARAAVWALLDAGAADVRVWNRTPERAVELCRALGGGTPVREAEATEILVHCTSSGLDGSDQMFKGLPLNADELSGYDCVVDLVYTDTVTPLVSAARERGIPAVDGLDLLVAQGALSFELFTGVSAPVDVMRAAARGT
jgi:shikimate dehydrogenase